MSDKPNCYRHTYAPNINHLEGQLYIVTFWYFGMHFTLKTAPSGAWQYRDRRLEWAPLELMTPTSARQTYYPEVTPAEASNILKHNLALARFKK